MFFRGSRYRNLPTSIHVTAKGEQVLSTEVRLIPATSAQFSHAVASRERLDLLAYKYYSDSTRWWQIADANPTYPFPLDLLDRRPIADELLVIVHQSYFQDVEALLVSLSALGALTRGPVDLMSASVAVTYTTGTRGDVLDRLSLAGFRLLSSFAWNSPDGPAEAFTFEAPAVKRQWRDLLAELDELPGVSDVVPQTGGEALELSYNEATIGRDSLFAAVERHGFSVVTSESQRHERIGTYVAVPPNRVT